MRADNGTSQRSNRNSAQPADAALIVRMTGPTVRPEVSRGTRYAEMPAQPAARSAVANTRYKPAASALVTNVFVPSMTTPSSAAIAVVRSANASDPLSGSVIVCPATSSPAHNPGNQADRWSSDPKRAIVIVTDHNCAPSANSRPGAAPDRPRSRKATADSARVAPRPPHAGSTGRPV